jgi:hypothetical protein
MSDLKPLNQEDWNCKDVNSEIPPLGLIPKFIHDELRLISIQRAMSRYKDANKDIPLAWTKEYNELILKYNDGWIKIESEDDLPKDIIKCYFILKSSNQIIQGHFRNGFFDYALNYFGINDVTHYQEIITPKPPIF